MSKTIFKKAFWALVVCGGLNWIAYSLHLYWSLWWIDMIVHFFGGLAIGLATFWVFSLKEDIGQWSIGKIWLVGLVGAIIVGIIWECYELYFGITALSDGIAYVKDTSSDLFMDTVGGVVSYFYISRLFKKYS